MEQNKKNHLLSATIGSIMTGIPYIGTQLASTLGIKTAFAAVGGLAGSGTNLAIALVSGVGLGMLTMAGTLLGSVLLAGAGAYAVHRKTESFKPLSAIFSAGLTLTAAFTLASALKTVSPPDAPTAPKQSHSHILPKTVSIKNGGLHL
jgi:hypothetical protein